MVCLLPIGAGTYILLQTGKKPTLVWPSSDDFWHGPKPYSQRGFAARLTFSGQKNRQMVQPPYPKKRGLLGPQPIDICPSCEGLKAYVIAKAVKKTTL